MKRKILLLSALSALCLVGCKTNTSSSSVAPISPVVTSTPAPSTPAPSTPAPTSTTPASTPAPTLPPASTSAPVSNPSSPSVPVSTPVVEPDTVVLDHETLTIAAGDTANLSAVTAGADTNVLEYASSNEAVATVTQEGLIEAKKDGETTITVTYGTAHATCVVTVTPFGVSFNESSMTLWVGDNEELGISTSGVATPKYEVVGEEGIVSLLGNRVIASGVGQVQIKVTYGDKTDFMDVTVKDVAINLSRSRYSAPQEYPEEQDGVASFALKESNSFEVSKFIWHSTFGYKVAKASTYMASVKVRAGDSRGEDAWRHIALGQLDDSGNWYGTLLAKVGNDQKLITQAINSGDSGMGTDCQWGGTGPSQTWAANLYDMSQEFTITYVHTPTKAYTFVNDNLVWSDVLHGDASIPAIHCHSYAAELSEMAYSADEEEVAAYVEAHDRDFIPLSAGSSVTAEKVTLNNVNVESINNGRASWAHDADAMDVSELVGKHITMDVKITETHEERMGAVGIYILKRDDDSKGRFVYMGEKNDGIELAIMVQLSGANLT